MPHQHGTMATPSTDTAGRSTIRRWVTYFLGVGLLFGGTLLAMGIWVAAGDPSGAALGFVAVAALVVGHLFARKMGVAR